MEEQLKLFKGELMEELVRNYFLNAGYFVVRGARMKFESNDLTDIDLFLYGRSSSILRERINVDIKNKKTPQAFERIVWANGIMKILGFDACIVATTDNRNVVHAFAQKHATTVLDGTFLQKLRVKEAGNERLSEDALMLELIHFKSYKNFNNKTWAQIYDSQKSRLLTELDFSGFHASAHTLNYFIDKTVADVQKRDVAIRMTYITISHLLIIMDFILKDIAFLELPDKANKLTDGLRFGNLGQDGFDRILKMAIQISGSSSAKQVKKSLEDIPVEILRDFFVKNENANNLFSWAKEFESNGYKKALIAPIELDPALRGVLSVFLDYIGLERKKYFEAAIISSRMEHPD